MSINSNPLSVKDAWNMAVERAKKAWKIADEICGKTKELFKKCSYSGKWGYGSIDFINGNISKATNSVFNKANEWFHPRPHHIGLDDGDDSSEIPNVTKKPATLAESLKKVVAIPTYALGGAIWTIEKLTKIILFGIVPGIILHTTSLVETLINIKRHKDNSNSEVTKAANKFLEDDNTAIPLLHG